MNAPTTNAVNAVASKPGAQAQVASMDDQILSAGEVWLLAASLGTLITTVLSITVL